MKNQCKIGGKKNGLYKYTNIHIIFGGIREIRILSVHLLVVIARYYHATFYLHWFHHTSAILNRQGGRIKTRTE